MSSYRGRSRGRGRGVRGGIGGGVEELRHGKVDSQCIACNKRFSFYQNDPNQSIILDRVTGMPYGCYCHECVKIEHVNSSICHSGQCRCRIITTCVFCDRILTFANEPYIDLRMCTVCNMALRNQITSSPSSSCSSSPYSQTSC